MLLGMLVVAATMMVVGFFLYGAYREAKRDWKAESWNHRGAV